MKILIIGANGQVGQALQKTTLETIALTRKDLDLQSYDGNADTLKDLCKGTPDVIINAAAYTAVDKCESEQMLAMKINAKAVKNLHQAAKTLGSRFVHYSTDYVFGGSKSEAYKETDSPSPINIYGATKLAGESQMTDDDLLIRTSWVHSPHGTNFVKTMLQLLSDRSSLDVIGDQFGVPTSAQFIAEKTYALLDKNLMGTYHIVPNGKTNWHEYACYIKEVKNLVCDINEISSAEYKRVAAKRPANSVLCNEKLATDLGENLPDWKIGVKETLDKLEV